MFTVYWLHDPENARVKIGLTDNLARRIAEIEREFRCGVKVVRTEQLTTRAEAFRLEAALHWHHRDLALGREWFHLPAVDTDCAAVVREYRASRCVEVRLPGRLLAELRARGMSVEQAVVLGLKI